MQVAGGVIGQPPVTHPVNFELQVNVKGRLVSEEEFGNIIVKTGPNGEKTLLKDVARIELGAGSYALRSLLNNKTAVALPIFQTPGANALQLSTDVRRKMEELKKNFPEGIDYSVVYDPTVFVRHSIEAVVHTLLEAILLVVIVVIIFLQTWRAAIIPLAAVPVSLVGTFSVMLAARLQHQRAVAVRPGAGHRHRGGRRHRRRGKRRAQHRARAVGVCGRQARDGGSHRADRGHGARAVRGVRSDGLHQRSDRPVLQTVRHHDRDFHGHLRVQLADAVARPVRGVAEGSSRAEGLAVARDGQVASAGSSIRSTGCSPGPGPSTASGSARVLRKSVIALVVYGGLVLLTGWSFNKVPTGFVPTQDKQYLVAFAQLPDGSSLDRTEAVIRRMSDIGLKQPGVEAAVAFPGLSINGFSVAPEFRHRFLHPETV